jgi:hypothetical protein
VSDRTENLAWPDPLGVGAALAVVVLHVSAELVDPIGCLVPGFEHWAGVRERTLRVTSSSLRVIARRPGGSGETAV